MIQTSHFKQPGLVLDDPRLVSIALWAPRGYRGRRYAHLAPRRNMFKMDETTYRGEYQKILDSLDPAKVTQDLGPEAIMLCWSVRGNSVIGAWLPNGLRSTLVSRCRSLTRNSLNGDER